MGESGDRNQGLLLAVWQCFPPVNRFTSRHDVTQNKVYREFYRHAQNKRIDEETEAYVKELLKTKASASNMAACLSQKTGKDFSRMDIHNLTRKLSEKETDKPTHEKILGEIQDNGGCIRYSRGSDDSVDVLMIQTKDMVERINSESPRLFQCDTTFGTSKQHYKLYTIIYHSNVTDKWEIAALIFLSTEVKEKVETGLNFFRESLSVCGVNISGSLIFYCDKDWDYITVNLYFSLTKGPRSMSQIVCYSTLPQLDYS